MKNSILSRLFAPFHRFARSARPVLACLVGFMGIFLSAPHLALAAPTTGTTTFPTSGGFTTIGNQTSPRSVNYLGFSFNAVSGGNVSISQAGTAVNLLVNSGGPSYLGFASDDSSKFKLSSFILRATNATYISTLTLTGYSAGSAVSGATSTLTLTASGIGNERTWDVSAITGFQNIDEVRITGPTTGTGGVALVSITIATAVTPAVAPTVTTATQSAVTTTSATLGGNVTADGGASVTERGIVWGTATAPTTANNKVQNGSGTGAFSGTVTGLPAGATVFVRAYAINSVNTSYGSEISFATQPPPNTVTSLNRVNPATTNLTTVNWTLTFAAANTGVSASNFSLSGAAAAGASVGSPTTSNAGVTWNVPVTTGSTDGTLTLSLANATGTTPGVSTTLPFTTAGQSYTMDKTLPTVISIVRQTPTSQTTSSTSLTFRVTFSEAVNAPVASNFAVAAVSSSITGSIGTVTAVNSSTYDVPVTITGGSGEFRLKVID